MALGDVILVENFFGGILNYDSDLIEQAHLQLHIRYEIVDHLKKY
jgi:hypothetical protein